MKFRYTILYVEDVPASLAFYESAFGLARKMLHDSGTYGELDTGETVLAFLARASLAGLGKTPGRMDRAAPVFEIALETDDVDAAFARAVAAGARPERDPEDMPWGQRISYVSDPDGVLVEICSAVASAG